MRISTSSGTASPIVRQSGVTAATKSAVAPWRWGRALYLAVNIAVLIFLLAPIAIVVVFALNPTPFIQFPPVGISLR